MNFLWDKNALCSLNQCSNTTDMFREIPITTSYLQDPDEEDNNAHGTHHVGVVAQKCILAAGVPEVEILCLIVIAIVS